MGCGLILERVSVAEALPVTPTAEASSETMMIQIV